MPRNKNKNKNGNKPAAPKSSETIIEKVIVSKPKAKAQAKPKAQVVHTQTVQKQTAPMNRAVSVSAGMHIVRRGKDMISVAGKEYITSVTSAMLTSSGNVTASTFYQLDINPLYMDGTRLQNEAKNWEKFRFKRLTFHYISAQSSTATGMIGMCYDKDVSDAPPPNTDAGLKQLMGFEDNKVDTVWAKFTLNCTRVDKFVDPLFLNDVGGDARLTYQGQLLAFVASTVAISGTTAGMIWIDYELDFFVAQSEATPTGYSMTRVGGGTFPIVSAETNGTGQGPTVPNALFNFISLAGTITNAGEPPKTRLTAVPNSTSPSSLALFVKEGLYSLEQTFGSLATSSTDQYRLVTPIVTAVNQSAGNSVPVVTNVSKDSINITTANQESLSRFDILKVPPGGGWIDYLGYICDITTPANTSTITYSQAILRLTPLVYSVYNMFSSGSTGIVTLKGIQHKNRDRELEYEEDTSKKFRRDNVPPGNYSGSNTGPFSIPSESMSPMPLPRRN